MTHGILRNENEGRKVDAKAPFDRKQVLSNTELNARLGEEGRELRERLHSRPHSPLPADAAPAPGGKKKYAKTKAPSALRRNKDGELDVSFNQDELSEWDKQRGQTERIIEPNTPYMGTAADTEYYEEDPVDLDLGGTVQ